MSYHKNQLSSNLERMSGQGGRTTQSSLLKDLGEVQRLFAAAQLGRYTARRLVGTATLTEHRCLGLRTSSQCGRKKA